MSAMRWWTFGLLLAMGCALPVQKARNILMITVDDLRPELAEAYGMEATKVQTPALDELARESTVFTRAYTQIAVCSPSRNSFMTGRIPDKTKVWNFIDSFRESGVGADWTTLPEYFKKHGYACYGAGKLYHPGSPKNNDFPLSWTDDAYQPFYWGNNATSDAKPCKKGDGFARPTSPWCVSKEAQGGLNAICPGNEDTDDDEYYDHNVASRTIESLQHVAAMAPQPRGFFIAMGLRRPHLAWRMPARFWDLYNATDIPVAKNQTLGDNVTVLAFERNGAMGSNWSEDGVHFYTESPDAPLPEDLQATLRRGYYSAVSFMDYEVGRVLDALDQLGLKDNTAVVFHSDHGWKLGEHGAWSKCTNWELDTRVPLMVRAPWLEASRGRHVDHIVELVDLYPTMADLAGLPPPSSEALDGVSFAPLLAADNPHDVTAKVAAFSQYPRCPSRSLWSDPEGWECLQVARSELEVMGYSVRTAEWRYTEWRQWKGDVLAGDWSAQGLVAAELYDHAQDNGLGTETFDDFENANVVGDERHKADVTALHSLLAEHFDKPHGPVQ